MRKYWEHLELLNAYKIKKYFECTDKLEYLQKLQPFRHNCEIWRNISLRCIFSMYSRRCLKTIETCNLLKIYSARSTFMPTEQRCSTNCKNYVFIENLCEYFPRYSRNVYLKVKPDKESFLFLALQLLVYYYFFTNTSLSLSGINSSPFPILAQKSIPKDLRYVWLVSDVCI